MKRFLLLLALITIYFIAHSQIAFNKLENFDYLETNATNIKRIGNNYFIQYFYTDSSLIHGMGILKTDEYGNVINRIEFGDSAFDYAAIAFKNVIATSDSFLIVAATRRYYYQQDYEVFGEIWKFDASLNTIWNNLLEHPDTAEASLPGAIRHVEVSDVAAAPDGGYVVSISYNRKCLTPPSFSNQRALLMKIDTAGTVEWVNRNNENYKVLHSLDLSFDSGYYVPTIKGNNGIPFKLNKFDKYGNYEWEVAANNHLTQTHAIASCEYDSTSAVMATFYKHGTQIGELGISVSKINTITRTVEWNKDFIVAEKMLSIDHVAPMDIRVDNNGGIFIATSGKLIYSSPVKGIVLKLNTNGDSLWTKYYEYNAYGNSETELNDLMILDDGSFVGVGSGLLNGKKLWFFKTNIGGYLGLEDKLNYRKLAIYVYPNPAERDITISFNEISDGIIQICSISGSLIKPYNVFSSDVFKINVANLPKGMYIIVFIPNDNTQKLFSKLIIQ